MTSLVLPPAQGLAFDRALRNPRPVFSLRQTLAPLEAAVGWRTERIWTGVGPELVARETVDWQDGLHSVRTELPSLGERARAQRIEAPAGRYRLETWLRSDRTGGQERTRTLDLAHAPVTLASLPLFVASHWDRLRSGETLRAAYLVLKVQRAATVRLQLEPAAPGRSACVRVTPENWLLRAIFGSTCLHLAGDGPVLARQDGLLDPRDLRPSGRWREYLGTIEWQQPWDLRALTPKKQKETQA